MVGDTDCDLPGIEFRQFHQHRDRVPRILDGVIEQVGNRGLQFIQIANDGGVFSFGQRLLEAQSILR